MALELYLIRHGESENNTVDKVGGQAIEVPLTARGRQQAAMLGEYLREHDIAFDRVYASTAVRAMDTARIALNGKNGCITYSDRLLELSQGKWVGKPRGHIYTPEQRAIIERDPLRFKAPGGESHLDVETRGLQFLDEIVDYRHTDGTAAIFGHGMLFKCMLHGILQFDPHMTWKIKIDNTSMTKLMHDDRGWHLEYVNATPHLNSRRGNYGT